MKIESLTINVKRCERCDHDHAQMVFKKFGVPVCADEGDTYTHWALCPTSGEPLLLKIVDDRRPDIGDMIAWHEMHSNPTGA